MIPTRSVPFLDLVTPHLELEAELVAAFRGCLESGHFVGGAAVEQFEREFARCCGVPHCVGVASGTDAVRFALMAAGVGEGDAIITVPNTFIATAEAITQAGALPLFVEVEEGSGNLDAESLREFLQRDCRFHESSGALLHVSTGRRVRAVVPVHLYGQMAEMDAILSVAGEFDLQVIEDACQAHGAAYYSRREGGWRKAGSMGLAAAFSFYPGKNLGACGEAGAVVTGDPRLAEHIRKLRDHGQARKYYHDIEGYNGRLDALQAAILSVKLKRLEGWNRQRRELAANYARLLADSALVLPQESDGSMPVYHLYVVRVPQRDRVQAELAAAGIGTGIHYPIPLPLQKAYSHLGYSTGDFPVSEGLAEEILSLPMYPQLTFDDQKYVAEKLSEAVAGLGSPAAVIPLASH